MKIKTYSASAVIALAVLSVAACGGGDDDTTTDGAGGAVGNEGLSSEIDELKAQIAALEELLESGDGDAEALQAALEEAQERLAELETCENGGDCQTRGEAIEELGVLTDAYCEWVFGCCTSDELAAGVSPAIRDAESCQDVYRSFLDSGASVSLDFEGSPFQSRLQYLIQDVLDMASTLGDRIQRGRIALSEEGLQQCVALIEAQSCGDEAESCVDDAELSQACEGYVQGLQQEGEACAGSGECADGLICDSDIYGSNISAYGVALSDIADQGTCLLEAEVDDPCLTNGQCATRDGLLYCDQEAGICKERPGAGEACEFVSPFFEGFSESVPCQSGLSCGLSTNTCVTECEADSRCNINNEFDCGEGLVCNITDNRASTGLSGNQGYCDEPFPKGKTATDPRECESGSIQMGACEGVGGDDCTSDDECRSGYCEDSVCLTVCEGDSGGECGANEYCEGSSNTCRATVALGESCQSSQDEQCSEGLCVNNTCQEPVGTGEDCDGQNALCEVDDYCAFTEGTTTSGYECVPRLASGEGCMFNRDCADGLGCFEGTCLLLEGRDVGDVCDLRFNCASQRCVDGLCVAGKAEGEACDADPTDSGSVNEDIGIDECADGLYCRREAPTDPSNMAGVCTAQGAPGSVCDGGVETGVPQCEGDVSCKPSSARQTRVCPVVYENSSEANLCIIEIPSVSVSQPNLMPSDPVIISVIDVPIEPVPSPPQFGAF